MKKVIYLMFITNILNAQIDSLDYLDIDFGFPGIKLEFSLKEISSTYEFRPYNCYNCSVTDSIAKKFELVKSEAVIIDNVGMDVRGLHFVNDTLFKINMVFLNDWKNKKREAVLNYFMNKYGRETKVQLGCFIWETSKTYLFLNLPEYNSSDNKLSYILIYSKRFDKIREKLVKNAENKKPQNYGRVGKGNGTFIPDVNSSVKLLSSNSGINAFEKSVPSFTLAYSDTIFKYNKENGKHDIFSSVRYIYSLFYKGIDVSVEVEVSKAKVITKMEYNFSSDPAIRFAVQRQQNGLIINETMTKMISKMSLNRCIVYDNSNKIHLTEYNGQHFKIEKY